MAEKRTFLVFTREVFVVEHDRVCGCGRVFVPGRWSMMSSGSGAKVFSILAQIFDGHCGGKGFGVER